MCAFVQQAGMCANSKLAICFMRVHSDPEEHSQEIGAGDVRLSDI